MVAHAAEAITQAAAPNVSWTTAAAEAAAEAATQADAQLRASA